MRLVMGPRAATLLFLLASSLPFSGCSYFLSSATSGITDSYPLPVYGILNERPHGPCRDTTVDLELVRRAIRFFADGS